MTDGGGCTFTARASSRGGGHASAGARAGWRARPLLPPLFRQTHQPPRGGGGGPRGDGGCQLVRWPSVPPFSSPYPPTGCGGGRRPRRHPRAHEAAPQTGPVGAFRARRAIAAAAWVDLLVGERSRWKGGARSRPAMSIMALMAGGLSPPRRGRLAAAAAATAAGCHRPDQARAGLADAQRDGGPGGAAAAGEGGNCGSGDGKRGGGGEGGGDGRRRHRARRRLARRACAPPHVRGGLVRPGRARWVCAPQPPEIIHDDRHDRWMRRAVAKGGGRGRGVVCPCRARSTSLLVSQQPTRPRLITRAAHACCPVKNVAAFLDMARIGTWTLIRFQSVCHVFCHFASCTSRGPLSRSLVWCHSMRPRATQGPSTVAGRPAAHPAPLMARARDALHV